ncbi:MAG: PD40 domain-containing protein [Lewinellaceae bacterium]|nr:PD40 domain-containing protein [Lewinellaceae bacterium]
MSQKLVALLLFSLLAWGALHAQPDTKGYKRVAEQYFSLGKYPEALQNYLLYQQNNPGDPDVKFRIGICYFETSKPSEALQQFSSLQQEAKFSNPLLYYYLGLCAHASYQFLDAINYYKEYLRKIDNNNPQRAMVKDQIRRCAFGLRIQQTKSSTLVENMGPAVNSSGDDFRPIPSPNLGNKIYFSSAREGNVGGLRDASGKEAGMEGVFNSDMFSTTQSGGVWAKPEPMSFLLNSSRNDVLLDFNKDGTQLYYFQGLTRFSGDIFIDTFRARPEDRSLFSPVFQGPVRPWEGDRDLHFFQDTILLFSSQRSGGFGGFDLYLSVFSKGFWSEPQNLGPQINTSYDERSPFLSIDGRTLYFSTNNPLRSLGGFDVIRIYFDDASESWLDPFNLGAPVNSAGDDLDFRLSRDGLRAYFSSTRKTGYGGSDLYVAFFRESQREQTRTLTPIVFSQVRDFKLEYARRMGLVDDPSAHFSEDQIEKYFLEPLYYDDKGEILTGRNMRTLSTIADLMVRFPQLKILLTSHSDGTDPSNVDLFFSAKRAEAAADYLSRNGVNQDHILIKAVGKNYPKALPTVDGVPNTTGLQLNRRIDITFLQTGGLPLRIRVKAPEVPEQMASQSWDFYAKTIEGLSYKLQIAVSPQMLTNDLLQRYPHPMIEKEIGTGNYQYTVGLYKTFKSASQLQQDLIRNGATSTRIIPYLNGLRIEDAQIASLTKDYPDLENLLQN